MKFIVFNFLFFYLSFAQASVYSSCLQTSFYKLYAPAYSSGIETFKKDFLLTNYGCEQLGICKSNKYLFKMVRQESNRGAKVEDSGLQFVKAKINPNMQRKFGDQEPRMFLDVENSILKECNDTLVRDKDLCTAMNNLYFKIFMDEVRSTDKVSQHLLRSENGNEVAYVDFKSLRLVFDDAGPNLKGELHRLHQRVVAQNNANNQNFQFSLVERISGVNINDPFEGPIPTQNLGPTRLQ